MTPLSEDIKAAYKGLEAIEALELRITTLGKHFEISVEDYRDIKALRMQLEGFASDLKQRLKFFRKNDERLEQPAKDVFCDIDLAALYEAAKEGRIPRSA